MSIASEISRLQTAKTDIKTAIEAKGVTVPSSATIDTYDDYVSQISGGGGSSADTQTLIDLIEADIVSLTIPNETTFIGKCAFYSYSSLTSVTIPNSVVTIGDYAFYSCGLTNITIPDSVTKIGIQSFRSCNRLTSVVIPNSITIVDGNAFAQCANLTSVTIGTGITTIGAGAFSSCSNLTSVIINATTPPTLSNANAFTGTNNCPIYVPSGSVDTYKAADKWSSLASRIQAIPNS